MRKTTVFEYGPEKSQGYSELRLPIKRQNTHDVPKPMEFDTFINLAFEQEEDKKSRAHTITSGYFLDYHSRAIEVVDLRHEVELDDLDDLIVEEIEDDEQVSQTNYDSPQRLNPKKSEEFEDDHEQDQMKNFNNFWSPPIRNKEFQGEQDGELLKFLKIQASQIKNLQN